MNMWKIFRGAFIGIVVGVVGAFLVLTMMKLRNKVNAGETAQVFGSSNILLEDEAGIDCDSVPLKVDDETIRIYDRIIRFHVKANSNSDEDIELKYHVRDEVVYALAGLLETADSKEEAKDMIYCLIGQIEELSEECIAAYGYDYSVKVELGSKYFPMREYGDIILPAGTYDALTINIGEAEGENFWCMLYPAACYSLDCAAAIDESGKERIKRLLTEEEFEKLFYKDQIAAEDIEFGSRLWDEIVKLTD